MGVKQTIASFCPVWAISWWKRRPHKEDILLKHPIRYFGEGVLLGRSLYQAYRGCIKLRIDTFCLLLAWATLSNLSTRDLSMMLSSNEIWYNGGCGVGCVSQADVRNEGRLGDGRKQGPRRDAGFPLPAARPLSHKFRFRGAGIYILQQMCQRGRLCPAMTTNCPPRGITIYLDVGLHSRFPLIFSILNRLGREWCWNVGTQKPHAAYIARTGSIKDSAKLWR